MWPDLKLLILLATFLVIIEISVDIVHDFSPDLEMTDVEDYDYISYTAITRTNFSMKPLKLIRNRDNMMNAYKRRNFTRYDFERTKFLNTGKWQKSRVMQFCRDNKRTLAYKVSVFQRLLFNDKYKVIYCHVPYGATSVERMFLKIQSESSDILFRSNDNTRPDVLCSNMTHCNAIWGQIEQKLKTYHKFMIVRNPLDRLHSVFNKSRLSFSNESYDSNFTEFLSQVFTGCKAATKMPINNSLLPLFEVCDPCLIKYDFYINYYAIEQSMKNILNILNIPQVYYVPTTSNELNASVIERHYKDVPQDLKEEILKYYSIEIKFYNLLYPNKQILLL